MPSEPLSQNVNASRRDHNFDALIAKPLALYLVGFVQVLAFWGIAPLWLCAFIVACIGIRAGFSTSSLRWFRPFAVLVALLSFFAYFRFNLTVEMAACFLWLSLSLKLLELKGRRDVLVYIYTMFYLSAVSMLFKQSLWQLLLQLVLIVIGLSVLLRLNGGSAKALRGQWLSLFKVMALALPLVLIMFLFFPRLAPLWSIPIKAKTAITGMSDQISPGDIAELANSDARAFRVRFEGAVPSQRQLYWRAAILDAFDGKQWRRQEDFSQVLNRSGAYDLGRTLTSVGPYYEVLMEPHNQKWVYALSGSAILSSHLKQRDMGLYELPVAAIQASVYRMRYPSQKLQKTALPTAVLVPEVARLQSSVVNDLRLPEGANPRTVAYAKGLRARVASDTAFVAELMTNFRQQNYHYSLKTGGYGTHYIDEFLFDSKRGFCAHYASSLVFMLRAAGIPSRMAVGYQGGQWIENDYLLVRQYDAHAWVEAKVDGQWLRLDPTAMVAPERIEASLEQALAQEGSFLANNAMAQLRHNVGLFSWAALKLDQLNYRWQDLVVNYRSEDQDQLFASWFGEFSWSKLASILVLPFVLVSALVALGYWLYSDRAVRSRAQKRYLRWLRVMALLGYGRHVAESPRQYLRRIDGQVAPCLYRQTKRQTKLLEAQEYLRL